MRKLIIILLVCSSRFANGQLCVQADCKDSIRLPQDSILLNAVVTPVGSSTVLWKLIQGSGTITGGTTTQATVKGLTAGTNIFQVTAQTASQTTTAMDTVVTMAACPICPVPIVCPVIPPKRTVTNITWDGVNKRWTFMYSDGGTSFL